MAVYLTAMTFVAVAVLVAATSHCTDQGMAANSLLQVSAKKSSVKSEPHRKDSKAPLNKTESDFVADLFFSFGKQSPTYSGAQTLSGFRQGAAVDDAGLFAFDDSIKSVAIDVGAASNPLLFDRDVDANHMVLAFEPVFDKTLAVAMEKEASEVNARGGCATRWEPACGNNRLVVFPSAVSSEVGYATFHLARNPYCGSLNTVPGGLDPTLLNHPDKDVRDVMKSCWGSLDEGQTKVVPTVTLASIISRIPDHIRIKYMKIDAQGQDFKILMSAGEQISRIEYVRFEMQNDPPPGRKMVQDIPSYADVVSKMTELKFVHESPSACNFDKFSSNFSKAIMEQECIFCRQLPCKEGNMPPMGTNPRRLLKKA